MPQQKQEGQVFKWDGAVELAFEAKRLHTGAHRSISVTIRHGKDCQGTKLYNVQARIAEIANKRWGDGKTFDTKNAAENHVEVLLAEVLADTAGNPETLRATKGPKGSKGGD